MAVILGIFDIKLGSYVDKTIFPHANVLVGLRFYSDTLRGSPIAAHPEDYRIDNLGTIDLDTGAISPCPPVSVVNVQELWPQSNSLPADK